MKRVLCILLIMLMLFGISACNSLDQPDVTDPTEPTDETEAIIDTQHQSEPTEIQTEIPTETTPVLLSYQIYLPNENADGLVVQIAEAEQITFNIVLTELQDRGALPETVHINTFDIVDGQLNIDFNQSFGDLVCSMGTSGELMVIGSVVNTFLDAFQAESVCFTVDGHILESGHVIYDFPIRFIEPNN